jgi:hypothetical protein
LKIATPDRSDVPIFEPGLHPLMVRNIAAGRLPSTNLLRYRAFGLFAGRENVTCLAPYPVDHFSSHSPIGRS